MIDSLNDRQAQVESALEDVKLPDGISIRAWQESDFPAIQRLSSAQGWPTPEGRADESLKSWRNSWPTLVALEGETVIGFLRSISDGLVTTYLSEILVVPEMRGKGLGQALIEVCHCLVPHTRIDLLCTDGAETFYERTGFRAFPGYRKSYH